MPSPRLVASFFPLAAVVFSAAFIAVEHFTGGVKTHHFLAREDLPGFSNWLSLFILPVLGMIVGFRAHALCLKQTVRKLPAEFTAAVAGSLLYGAILACSFLFGFEQVTVAVFFSLFLISIVFPVYRSEYSFGFVTGMTIAFGSVIPLAFSAVFSAASFVARRFATLVVTAIRKPRR